MTRHTTRQLVLELAKRTKTNPNKIAKVLKENDHVPHDGEYDASHSDWKEEQRTLGVFRAWRDCKQIMTYANNFEYDYLEGYVDEMLKHWESIKTWLENNNKLKD